MADPAARLEPFASQTAPRGARGPGRAAARATAAGRARICRGGRSGSDLGYLRESSPIGRTGSTAGRRRRRLRGGPASASGSAVSGSTLYTLRLRRDPRCRLCSATAGRTRSGATSRSCRSSPTPARTAPTRQTRSTCSCPTCPATGTHWPAAWLDRAAGRAHGRPGRFGAAGADVGSDVSVTSPLSTGIGCWPSIAPTRGCPLHGDPAVSARG